MAKDIKDKVQSVFDEYKKTHPKITIKFIENEKAVILEWAGGKTVKKFGYKSAYNFLSKGIKIKNDDLFKFDSIQKQIKKQWKSVSCSMTMEEYKELQSIAKRKGVKINQLIRTVLLRVIESNK